MFGWAKQQMANVVGTAEPIHGPSAIHSVATQTTTTPYTETTRADVKWAAKRGTSVETQSFYLMTDSGHLCLVQVIYSCVAGLHTTCQFNTKVFYPKDQHKPNLWSSDALSNVEFSDDKNSFFAKDVALELNAAGDAYTVKSMTNQASIVNMTVKKTAPGFQVGTNGTTTYGFDAKKPWGAVRHVFWPRNTVEGTIMTKEGPIDVKGRALFIHALQDMKPHHAAAKWSFCDFAGSKYSAILMEFTTPPSYGSTVVNVGGIVSDTEVITAGATNTVAYTSSKGDVQNDWPEPTAVKFTWDGKTKDGKQVTAVLEGPFGDRLDKVDVMAEVPKFVKQIVAGAVGTKPYIYQYATPMTLKLKIGDEEVSEEGRLFSEATFISA